MPKILLIDDHVVVREALHKMLESEAGFQIVGEAADGVEAVRLTENLKPDILIVDLMLKGMNGLEVTRQVASRFPGIAIIILSMYGSDGYVHEALQAGAKAYVLKESSSEDLIQAIHEVQLGKRYLSPPLSDRAIEVYIHRTENFSVDPYDSLTSREREVLHMAAQGSTNAEIASRLFISRRTVEVHRANMMQKLGLKVQGDLIRYAMQRGILPPATEIKSS